MTVRIYLVRHGESSANACWAARERVDGGSNGAAERPHECQSLPETPLTEHGERQAALTAPHLRALVRAEGACRVAVLASPFRRAQQTMAPFGHALGPRFESATWPLLREYERSDTLEAFGERVRASAAALRSLAATLDGARTAVVVFAHSHLFSLLVPYLASQERTLPPVAALAIPNCSITTLEFSVNTRERPWRVREIGSTRHLDKMK